MWIAWNRFRKINLLSWLHFQLKVVKRPTNRPFPWNNRISQALHWFQRTLFDLVVVINDNRSLLAAGIATILLDQCCLDIIVISKPECIHLKSRDTICGARFNTITMWFWIFFLCCFLESSYMQTRNYNSLWKTCFESLFFWPYLAVFTPSYYWIISQ